MGRFKFILLAFYLCLFAYTLSPLAKAENSSVSVTVAPKATDFQLGVQSSSSASAPQGSIITYTITYGSFLSYTDSLTIEAQWDQGTIQGNTLSSVDGLSYVPDSGTTAYAGTNPTVDLVNNKIDWNIPSFPSQTTNKTVSFQLQLNAAYVGTQPVSYPIKVRIISPYFTTPDQLVTTTYVFDPTLVTPTPTPTPLPSATPTPKPENNSSPASSITPTPTPGPTTKQTSATPTPQPASGTKPTAVQNISILDLSQDSAQIALSLNKQAKTTVVYGTSPTSLTGTIGADISGQSGVVSFDRLTPQTTYYMQIITTDSSGKTTKSDIFSVQTAQISDKPEVSKTSLVVASDNDVVYSQSLNTSGGTSGANAIKNTPQIPIAQNSNYNIAFKLTKLEKIKTVSMLLKNTSVLGVSTFSQQTTPLEYSFPVTQNAQGVYSTQLKNPSTPGFYDAFIRIADYDGNITTQKIAELHVLKPFRVYNAVTKKPIEDARILLFAYNDQTNRYEQLPNVGGMENPLYTNKNGEASESLAKGSYKANFGRIGYAQKDTVVFSIGTTPKDDLPTVYLSPTPITPLSVLNYYENAFSDYLSTTHAYIAAIQESYRYFDLIGLGVLFCFTCICFLLFGMKTHITFAHLPSYFHHNALLLFGGRESPYIHGSVADKKTKLPVDGADVFILDEETHKVLAQTTTNRAGGFLLTDIHKRNSYLVYVLKQGYEPSGQIGYSPKIVIPLEKGETVKKHIVDIVSDAVQDSAALFFEFTLLFTLVLELALFPAFGFSRTIPFLGISILNIILWAFYLREKGKQLSIH